MLYKVVLTFEDEILKCDHSNESYWVVLSYGTVYYAVQGVSNFRVCELNPKVWPFKWKLLSSTIMMCCLSFDASLSGNLGKFGFLDTVSWGCWFLSAKCLICGLNQVQLSLHLLLFIYAKYTFIYVNSWNYTANIRSLALPWTSLTWTNFQ